VGKITLAQAAKWCGGQLDEKYASVTFLGASGDHRWVQPGELFVTLDEGPHLNESIRVAMERGAVAVLCSAVQSNYPCIVVPDPRRALGDIARQERKRIGMRVVGVTGSRGKTTVTEMIACILQGTYRVGKTPSNQFDDIGVPMAILAMAEDTQVAVLEMGMNHYREIAYLTSVACPDIAVITNICGEGNEELRTREDVLRAKMEILEGMREGSRVLLNGDDDLLWKSREISQLKTLCYGRTNEECPVRAEQIEIGPVTNFRLSASQLSFPVELSLKEEHYVSDALAAICVGLEMGVPAAQIQERLSTFRNPDLEGKRLKVRDMNIISQCHLAGPESLRDALEQLGKVPGRRVAVLGEMLELGICARAEHYRIGRIAAENVEILLAFGPSAARTISGAITGGMNPAKVMAFTDGERLLSALDCLVKPGDTVLFKSSRRVDLQAIADRFMQAT